MKQLKWLTASSISDSHWTINSVLPRIQQTFKNGAKDSMSTPSPLAVVPKHCSTHPALLFLHMLSVTNRVKLMRITNTAAKIIGLPTHCKYNSTGHHLPTQSLLPFTLGTGTGHWGAGGLALAKLACSHSSPKQGDSLRELWVLFSCCLPVCAVCCCVVLN